MPDGNSAATAGLSDWSGGASITSNFEFVSADGSSASPDAAGGLTIESSGAIEIVSIAGADASSLAGDIGGEIAGSSTIFSAGAGAASLAGDIDIGVGAFAADPAAAEAAG
jgi:hypothetical protein